MKNFFNKLYDHIEVSLFVCLLISFALGAYHMMTKAGGPTTIDYIMQAVLGMIIIGDSIFLVNERKKVKHT